MRIQKGWSGAIGILIEGGWFSLNNISSVNTKGIRFNKIRIDTNFLLSEIKR